ncbi:MAG: glycoside hydrolase family 97 protein [Terriglobales bacterium]
MKILSISLFLLFISSTLLAENAAAQSSYDLRSPDGRIEIRIRTAEQINYDVVLNGAAVLRDCPLSLDIDHKKLGLEPKVLTAKKSSADHVLEPVVHQKSAKILEKFNELRLEMDGSYAVVFRAYNEGVAYRFETSLPQAQVKVYGEEVHFNFPGVNTVVYYGQEDSFYSHNERHYVPLRTSEILPEFLATLPAVAEAAEGAKLAIAEAGVEDYPGMWLRGTGGPGLVAAFPPYPLKEVQTSDRDFRVTEAADYIAVTSGTRTYPWRLVGITEHDGDLLTNQLVWLLEKPSQLEDTSWIKPGMSTWDWWCGWNLYGVDFKAGVNTATYKYYVDFAAAHGIPYILLDEGWYKLGNVLEVAPDLNMEELSAYAKQKNVGILLWLAWKSLDDQLIPALDLYAKWGVKGIKVDFMQRSDQLMIDFFYKVSSEAAKRKMLVDFHGDQKPASMTRTWPNLIGTEGVRGMEWSKWSWESEPKHNMTLPFTRMFLGPMDFTPGAMRNATRATFAPIGTQPMAMGTRCNQLAMYVVFDSPLGMLSDSPSNYLREPDALDFLTAVPTTWDETKALDAKIAEYALVARRNGRDWYLGAMTDWTPRDLTVDFSFLPEGTFWLDAYSDGVNADRNASDYKREKIQVTKSTKLKIHLASGGGWAARLHP